MKKFIEEKYKLGDQKTKKLLLSLDKKIDQYFTEIEQEFEELQYNFNDLLESYSYIYFFMCATYYIEDQMEWSKYINNYPISLKFVNFFVENAKCLNKRISFDMFLTMDSQFYLKEYTDFRILYKDSLELKKKL